MTASPEIIPTDLAIEIGENLSPDGFMAAARAFFGYVEELSKMMSPEGGAPKWTVLVKEGSAVLGVCPDRSASTATVNAIYARAEEGVRQLTNGEIEESGLTETALKHLKVLSELTEDPRRGRTPIRLWVRRRPVEMERAIANFIKDDWRVDYTDFGTVEGRLETIQDKNGTLQLQLRDAVLRHSVRCFFPEELLQEAFSSFRKRVEVSGPIHHRRNGTPVSIDVVAMERLPDDEDLPTADQVRGILRLNA